MQIIDYHASCSAHPNMIPTPDLNPGFGHPRKGHGNNVIVMNHLHFHNYIQVSRPICGPQSFGYVSIPIRHRNHIPAVALTVLVENGSG